jgi:hypothetical protein
MSDEFLHSFLVYFGIGVITLPLLRLLVYIFHRKEQPSAWFTEVSAALAKERTLKEKLKKSLNWFGLLLTFCLAWPVVILVAAHALFVEKTEFRSSSDEPRFTCQKDSLIKQVDPLVVESSSYVTDPLGRVPNLPFGHLHQGWIGLLAQLEHADELWMFKTKGWSSKESGSPKYLQPRNVSSGFAVIRDKKVVAEFICSSD